MSPPYEVPRRDQSGPADLAGFVVLGGCAVLVVFWYIAVSRLHLRNSQCLEVFLDLAICLFGIALVLSHFIGRRTKREEMWPHPAVTIAGARDAVIVEAAMLTLCVHCKKLVEQCNIKPSIDFGLLNNSDTHRHFRGWILGKLRFLPHIAHNQNSL